MLIAVGVMLALSVIAFIAIAWDKRCAEHNRRRVPETTLHIIELLGGWPGSWLAQRAWRHKTSKLRYRVVFWICAIVNVALVATAFVARAHLDQ